MFRLSMAGVACALSLAASPAAAEPYQTFVDTCLATNADRSVAGQGIKAEGWYAAPPEIIALFSSDIRDAAMFTNIDLAGLSDKAPPADFESLVTGWADGDQTFGISDIYVDICMVFTLGGDASALRARLQRDLGVAPVEIEEAPAFLFSRQGDGFRDESAFVDVEDSQVSEMVRTRKVYMAAVIEDEDMIGLLLAAPRARD